MSLAIIPVFEKRIKSSFDGGEKIARELAVLDEIADTQKIQRLGEFDSQYRIPDDYDGPPLEFTAKEKWFKPSACKKTISVLIKAVQRNPERFEQPDFLVEDLRRLNESMLSAIKQKTRIQLKLVS